MAYRIAYNDSEGLKILVPAIEIDPIVLGEKDVPEGIRFIVINESDLPSRETRPFWKLEINELNGHGIGLSKQEFYEKYPDKVGWSVK